MNRNEKVNRRNLFRMEMKKFNLGHTEVLGLYKNISGGDIQATAGDPGLEFKS